MILKELSYIGRNQIHVQLILKDWCIDKIIFNRITYQLQSKYEDLILFISTCRI